MCPPPRRQRASVVPEGTEPQDVPPRSYRIFPAKGLTPEQMAWSTMRATGVLDRVVASTSTETKFTFKDYINGRIAAPDNLKDTLMLFVSMFGNPPGEAETTFQPSLGQALFLMNEPLYLPKLTSVGWMTATGRVLSISLAP